MIKKIAALALFLLSVTMITACLVADSTYTRIPPGIWRGVLQLDPIQFPVHSKDTVFVLYDQYLEGQLPFNFEVTYLDEERFTIDIINGRERVHCDSIVYGRDRSRARDTFNVFFPEYQSYIHAEVRGGNMQGEWVLTSKENYHIPFYATAGRDYRFTAMKKAPTADLTGAWATLFGVDTKKTEKAIGEFQQEGNHLTGTFRTETGDYRFLDGSVQGGKFWLSCFDGAHAFLFTGSIKGDSLQGEFRSGTHYRTLWTAWRDASFQLGNPDSLTYVKPGAPPISFTLPEVSGKQVQYPGPAFEGKIRILSIMGTWCPNCRDEQAFLVDYLKNHPEIAAQTAVVGLSFERDKKAEDALAHLKTYKERMHIPYDIVYAGPASSKEAEALLPSLNHVMSFPTMIILDKNNRVRRVHTGFDGPASSKYKDFTQNFDQLMQSLIHE